MLIYASFFRFYDKLEDYEISAGITDMNQHNNTVPTAQVIKHAVNKVSNHIQEEGSV
jgi:hypothetical protein